MISRYDKENKRGFYKLLQGMSNLFKLFFTLFYSIKTVHILLPAINNKNTTGGVLRRTCKRF